MPGDGRCRQATRECPKVRRDVRTLANAPCCLALLETPVRWEIPQEPAPIEEGVPYARGRKRAMRARWSGSRDGREGGRNAIANFQVHSRRGSEENMEFEASEGSWMSRIPTNQCPLSWQLSPAWWGPVARGMEGCFGKCRFVQRQSCRSKKKVTAERYRRWPVSSEISSRSSFRATIPDIFPPVSSRHL